MNEASPAADDRNEAPCRDDPAVQEEASELFEGVLLLLVVRDFSLVDVFAGAHSASPSEPVGGSRNQEAERSEVGHRVAAVDVLAAVLQAVGNSWAKQPPN